MTILYLLDVGGDTSAQFMLIHLCSEILIINSPKKYKESFFWPGANVINSGLTWSVPIREIELVVIASDINKSK